MVTVHPDCEVVDVEAGDAATVLGLTDGSRLTEMGVPTPNIFTGMQEIHGPLEWVSVQDMAAAVRVLLRLVRRS